jgi:hypothetical protein
LPNDRVTVDAATAHEAGAGCALPTSPETLRKPEVAAVDRYLVGRAQSSTRIPASRVNRARAVGHPCRLTAPGIFTSRADLAASMLEQVTDSQFISRAVAVTTVEGPPTLWQVMRREPVKQG